MNFEKKSTFFSISYASTQAKHLLWTIYSAHTTAADYARTHRWSKTRNEREALTLARMIDLAVAEHGVEFVGSTSFFEVGLRRFHALFIADKQSSWRVAEQLEEIPPVQGSMLAPKIERDLLQQVDLQLKMEKALKGQSSDEHKADA